MANEIEMDTSMLERDTDSLETTVAQLETQFGKMFEAVKRMDSMWNGPAHDTFNAQFQDDYQNCKDICAILKELIGSMNHAREEYDKCERNVNSMIGSIRI